MVSDPAISYASSVETTKATETDLDVLKSYGWFSVATFLTDDSDTHYFTDEVEYKNDIWTSPYTRYWPVSYNLNLFAYTPKKDFIVINNPTDYSDYSLTYTCPPDIDDQVDLLARTLSDQAPTDSNDPIKLEFKHLLSSIKFQVTFDDDETNVTLNSIAINYVNIENERTYSFVDEKWGDSEQKYFDATTGMSTSIDIDDQKLSAEGGISFTEINNQLMIIPQPISSSESDPHYISVQISYTLNSVQDNYGTYVQTGVMPLPSPNTTSTYNQSEVYTYSITVNGEQIVLEAIEIEEQENPVDAYGNIDLGLITERTTAADIGYTSDKTTSAYYYTTGLRVKNLLLDGVTDFVVVGSMGATGDNHLGDGKLGYYGGDASPFNIGSTLAGGDNYFSVDLRGTYDYPEFQYANTTSETSDESVSTTAGSDIADTDPTFTAGLFSKVYGLTEVILPHGVMAIGNHAFEDCDALESIDIADVKHIEIGEFQHASALKTVLNGAPLTRVHDNGFDQCESLTTIDLSKVTQIDQYGFVNCESLTDVNLQNLTVIGIHAFDGCSSLTLQEDTNIPAFKTVSDYAFSGCSQLCINGTMIDLTEATEVGDHAFNDCTQLLLSDGYLGELTYIDQNAFAKCEHIGTNYEVHLPEIEHIGDYAFSYCEMLNVVEGLDNLTEMNTGVFTGCFKFTGYSSAATTNKYLSLPLVETVDATAFYNSGVTDVRFSSDKLTWVGRRAFGSCSSLVSLTGLEGVTFTDELAFSQCPKLEELVLTSLTDEGFGGGLFYLSSGLKKLSLPLITNNNADFTSTIYNDNGEVTGTQYNEETIIGMLNSSNSTIQEIDLPKLITTLDASAFRSAEELHTANFASITGIGNYAFYGCSALTSIDLSATEYVGDGSFEGCSLLPAISLPLVEEIPSYLFTDCSSLATVDIPNATSIGNNAFDSCTSLTAFSHDKVTSVGSSAFEDCTILEKLILPDAQTFESSAIKGCSLLETLIIPNVTSVSWSWGALAEYAPKLKYVDLSSVSEVSGGIFSGCENIIAVDLSSATTLGQSTFSSCSSLVRLDLSGITNDDEGTGCYEVTVTDDNGDYLYSYWMYPLFWSFSNAANCEIWLSEEQAAKAEDNKWQGQTWKAIHTTDTFTLIVE